ncbi:hypothetical protein IW261DRAFT_1416316 [Armillaria novae-zelandiae]|uniref:Uncharacterized protein n=1 Tax=Armillaria novae-zelandiae TaxID=153914 RepID=A0AA39UGM6_9AGAR|nr:hypothetical protein IW261DRAFT_1416316 [Armillaria novae-zelandiae]
MLLLLVGSISWRLILSLKTSYMTLNRMLERVLYQRNSGLTENGVGKITYTVDIVMDPSNLSDQNIRAGPAPACHSPSDMLYRLEAARDRAVNLLLELDSWSRNIWENAVEGMENKGKNLFRLVEWRQIERDAFHFEIMERTVDGELPRRKGHTGEFTNELKEVWKPNPNGGNLNFGDVIWLIPHGFKLALGQYDVDSYSSFNVLF